MSLDKILQLEYIASNIVKPKPSYSLVLTYRLQFSYSVLRKLSLPLSLNILLSIFNFLKNLTHQIKIFSPP